MKRISAFWAVLLSLLTVSFGAYAQELFDYDLQPGDFTKLKVVNDVNVIYRCSADSAGHATFQTDRQLADAFILTPKNGTLKVEFDAQIVGDHAIPTITVYSRYLSEVENSSVGTVYVESVAPCPKFKAVQIGNGRIILDDVDCTELVASINTGNGSIIINGECTDARFRMVGTGLIQADGLKAQNVYCKTLGTGSIGCWPVYMLKATGLGSTKIYYKGHPEIHKLGTAKLLRLEDAVIDNESMPLLER